MPHDKPVVAPAPAEAAIPRITVLGPDGKMETDDKVGEGANKPVQKEEDKNAIVETEKHTHPGDGNNPVVTDNKTVVVVKAQGEKPNVAGDKDKVHHCSVKTEPDQTDPKDTEADKLEPVDIKQEAADGGENQSPAIKEEIASDAAEMLHTSDPVTIDGTQETSVKVANPHDDIPVFIFHPDTDTRVTIVARRPTGAMGPPVAIAHFEVSAVNIATASRVWRRVVYGGHASDSSNEMQHIILEGHPTGIKYLFRICHFSFERILDNISIDSMRHVVMEALEYSCTHLLRPWAKAWIRHLETVILTQEHSFKEDTILSIAFCLGALHMYDDAIKKLILQACIKDGYLVDESGCKIKELNLPQQAVDHIGHQRLVAVKQLFGLVSMAFQTLARKTRDRSYCKAKENQRECETAQLGSTMRAMIDMDLYPVPDAVQYEGSVETLADFLEGFRPAGLCEKHLKPHERLHYYCGIRLKDDAERVKAKIKTMRPDQVEMIRHNASIVGTEYMSDFASYAASPLEVADED
ncbi:hypothetical protein MKZ38_009731 [Zalerion maritima]|uniref:Uncharacterized protein n=1 Tax=Zalerion maritima TaxID=339359 RepID=A0AAD5RUR6_9PEZI|nr:hypothetical protein MKZ38_009731 [Zalerion maritima]